jgi:hypothetical protein
VAWHRIRYGRTGGCRSPPETACTTRERTSERQCKQPGHGQTGDQQIRTTRTHLLSVRSESRPAMGFIAMSQALGASMSRPLTTADAECVGQVRHEDQPWNRNEGIGYE